MRRSAFYVEEGKKKEEGKEEKIVRFLKALLIDKVSLGTREVIIIAH